MATVTFSAADDLLYAYLAGEIDHDAAQNLRIQLDDALLARTPKTLVLDLGGVDVYKRQPHRHRHRPIGLVQYNISVLLCPVFLRRTCLQN